MAEIILDIGSGNTCKNDYDYAKRMVDEVIKIDNKKHKVVFKAQLFQDRPPNVTLKEGVFTKLWNYCQDVGYDLTASVFDIDSLDFLLIHNPPFIKIANDRSLDWLVGEIPRKYEVYRSVGTFADYCDGGWARAPKTLFCVSEYPAPIDKYPKNIDRLSDHTVGLELWYRNKPLVFEKHLKLPDSTGLDAGDFAITPKELEEIL